MNDIPVLDMNDNVETRAEKISNEIQIPPKARIDAFHISMAAVHGIQFLLTWHYKHISNPENHPSRNKMGRGQYKLNYPRPIFRPYALPNFNSFMLAVW